VRVALLLFLLSFSLRAEPQEIASSLTLSETVDAAVRDNAELRSMRAKWEAMQQRPVQARTLPNPMFSYSAMDQTRDYYFPDTSEKRFEVQQQFPWPGKLGLKGKIAEKDAAATEFEYQAALREVVMMVKEAYYDLYAVQQATLITHADLDVLKRMEQIAETEYSTGTRPQQDVLKAQTEITMLQQKLLEYQQQEAVLKAKLNQLLNRPPESRLGLAVTAPSAETEPQFERLFAIAEKARPELKKASTDIERSEYERDLMKKEFWPDYRLGLEYRNYRTDPDQLMFTIGFDLPIWQTKYRAAAREAEKMIEAGQAELQAVKQQTAFDVRAAQFKLLTARQSLELYRKQLIPQAKARFDASEAGYRAGKVDFIDLLESERFLLNARVMAAMAEGNVGTQAARLERAIGTELPRMEAKK
jgi:cobalt-zinc-cadmium efflux system outer membrane protein